MILAADHAARHLLNTFESRAPASLGCVLPLGRAFSDRMPLIEYAILAKLAAKTTDARGYAALQVAGYDVDAIDAAIEILHDAGLLNAFFVNRAARPKFHPSSLTREGRRLHDHYLQLPGA